MLQDLPELWHAGIDVVCVHTAACVADPEDRAGRVSAERVRELVATRPDRSPNESQTDPARSAS
jgi:hypothetical protein